VRRDHEQVAVAKITLMTARALLLSPLCFLVFALLFCAALFESAFHFRFFSTTKNPTSYHHHHEEI
jgi:hypothetical protein